MSSNEIRKIMNDCKNASSQAQIDQAMEELNRIKRIDLTFKGVKVA